MQKIKQILEENKLVLIIIFIFILLVAYKIISSNIQEKKEKAVIQERAMVAELAKKPLDDCLKYAFDHSMYNQNQSPNTDGNSVICD